MKQFEIWLVSLDPTVGSEMAKTRPAMILSPDEMNDHLQTLLVAPITHSLKPWPFRIPTLLNEEKGQLCPDQLRSVSKKRLVKMLSADPSVGVEALKILREMFTSPTI